MTAASMTVSDQEIISRFPVGYHQLHPNVSFNFQMNRFYGWANEQQMLEEMRTAAPRIAGARGWRQVVTAATRPARPR